MPRGVLGGPWEVIGDPSGVLGEPLGGLTECLGVPFGVLRGYLEGPCGTIRGLMKTLKNNCFLLCFQHLAVLGAALEVLGRSCGSLWGALGDPWEVLERSLGVLGASLGGPWGPCLRKPMKANVLVSFPRVMSTSRPAVEEPSRGYGWGKGSPD